MCNIRTNFTGPAGAGLCVKKIPDRKGGPPWNGPSDSICGLQR